MVLESLNEMPEKFELDELFERLIILDKIERGRMDVKEGRTNTSSQAKEKLRKWVK